MKRLILGFITSIAVFSNVFAQVLDDGLVTRHLTVDTQSEKVVSYFTGFNSGISKYKNGDFVSAESVVSYYGLNILQGPKLDDFLYQSTQVGYKGDFSTSFLTKLKNAISKIGSEYTLVDQLRSEFINIATSTLLSVKESEALALIDISLQTALNRLEETQTPDRSIFRPGFGMGGESICFYEDVKGDYNCFYAVNEIDFGRLPRWFKCGVGTIGSAILGGLTGAGTGFTIGGLLGGVIGGLVGVVSGTMTGVAAFCD